MGTHTTNAENAAQKSECLFKFMVHKNRRVVICFLRLDCPPTDDDDDDDSRCRR